jgi:ubiquinone/menaquinone biosynthesis C-methylase UbiE
MSMPVVMAFERHAEQYDRWFGEHERLYLAEVAALQRFITRGGLRVEVGVGTGRFASRLGITFGVEPSRQMARLAGSRGVAVCQAVGEQMPFCDGQFDMVLLVTVICFVDDVPTLLRELGRVLKSKGRLIVGFIDRRSALGQVYEARRETSTFYREARFYAVEEVAEMVRQTGFKHLDYCQTLLGPEPDAPDACEVHEGYGEGAFVVLKAEKSLP